jgi:hypothetical protein
MCILTNNHSVPSLPPFFAFSASASAYAYAYAACLASSIAFPQSYMLTIVKSPSTILQDSHIAL